MITLSRYNIIIYCHFPHMTLDIIITNTTSTRQFQQTDRITEGRFSNKVCCCQLGQFHIPCEEGPSIVAYLLTLGSVLLVLASMPLSLIFVVKVVQVIIK